MRKQVSATDAKNNFGGLLDDVASLGRVDIVRHGRLVAVVLSPVELAKLRDLQLAQEDRVWGRTHMIPPERARQAQVASSPHDFDED